MQLAPALSRSRVLLAAGGALAVLALVLALLPGRVVAAPTGDGEGGTAALQRKLDAAASAYNNAHARAQASQRRQAALTRQIAATEKRIATLGTEVQEISGTAYRSGGLPTPAAALANSRSLSDALAGAALIDGLSRHRQGTLDDLVDARADLLRTSRAVKALLVTQRAAERTMAERRADAEKALRDAQVGGQPTRGYTQDGRDVEQPDAAGGGTSSGSRGAPAATGPSARRPSPAPRRGDGTWPSESCSLDDPTSGGCLTPRTLHALQQTKAAGFTRYVHCFRQASFGEHPKGRACDFSATVGGFAGVATGGNRQYGNRLAAWYVDNADRLAVLYVIWFRQIWLPGSGWRAYQSSSDPSAAHMNHVHLSVQ